MRSPPHRKKVEAPTRTRDSPYMPGQEVHTRSVRLPRGSPSSLRPLCRPQDVGAPSRWPSARGESSRPRVSRDSCVATMPPARLPLSPSPRPHLGVEEAAPPSSSCGRGRASPPRDEPPPHGPHGRVGRSPGRSRRSQRALWSPPSASTLREPMRHARRAGIAATRPPRGQAEHSPRRQAGVRQAASERSRSDAAAPPSRVRQPPRGEAGDAAAPPADPDSPPDDKPSDEPHRQAVSAQAAAPSSPDATRRMARRLTACIWAAFAPREAPSTLS